MHSNGYNSKGIWILSNRKDITFTLIDSKPHFISFFVKKLNSQWSCSTIYVSLTPTLRISLWDHLRSLSNSILDLWLFMGDFNKIIHSSKVQGGNFHIARAQSLSFVFIDCGLLDPNTKGAPSHGGGILNGVVMLERSWKKLCQILPGDCWSLKNALAEIFPMHNSDHNPIYLHWCKYITKKNFAFSFSSNLTRSSKLWRYCQEGLTYYSRGERVIYCLQ